MAQDVKSVLGNSVLYTFGNMLLKVFSFFLIPLYTSYLAPEQYGILNLSVSFTALSSCIITLGLQFAVIRFYADFRENLIKVGRMFGTIILSVLSFGIFFSSLLYFTKDYWCPLFFKEIDFFPVVFLSILISLVSGLYTVYQDSLKGMQQARKSVLLTYVFFFLLLGTNILTVVVWKMGAAGILGSTLLVNSIMLVVMLIDLNKQGLFVFCIDRTMLFDLLKYSFPIVPHTMSYNVSNFVTRIIINGKMSASSLGLFSLASQFGSVSDIALNSVQSAFQPWMFSRLNEEKGVIKQSIAHDVARTSYLLMWLYGLMYIMIGSFSQEAVILMAAESYHSAWIYVPAMVFTVAIKGPLFFYNNFLYYQKDKTIFIFIATFVSSLVNILFTWLLIPLYGILGSIAADIIAMAVRFIIIIPVIYKQASVIYSFVKLAVLSFIPMLFMTLALVPSFYEMIDDFWINILYKFFVLGLYGLCIVSVYRNKLMIYLKQLIRHN